MILGGDDYFECPICNTFVSRPLLLSGNTFKARLYSDGKKDAPMLPEFPAITKCPNCQHIYWLNANTKCEKKNSELISSAEFLSAFDFQRAIDEGLASNRENDIYLMQRILWTINDRFRYGLSLFTDYETRVLWNSNQLRLLAILDENQLNEKILIAEICRNMGAFSKSRDLISSIEHNDLDWLKAAFIENIDKRNKNVFEIKLL